MSQFNKYLKIVQEGKDYQYNEMFGFLKKDKNFFQEKIDDNKGPVNEILVIDYKNSAVEKIKDDYNTDYIRAIVIGFLKIGKITTGYLRDRYTIYHDPNEAEKIMKIIDSNEEYTNHVIQRNEKRNTKSTITYNTITYENELEKEKEKKAFDQETYDRTPR